jgi:hypothetical protein
VIEKGRVELLIILFLRFSKKIFLDMPSNWSLHDNEKNTYKLARKDSKLDKV